MQRSVEETSGVGVLLLSLFLVKKLGKKCNIRRFEKKHVANDTELGAAEQQTSVFDVGRAKRTCLFVYSLIGKRECGVAACLGVSLFLRSLCDLKMVHLMTAVESSIVNRKKDAFKTSLRNFLGFIVPVSALNALLNYSINELALCLRENLSTRLLEKYTSNNTFYQINSVFGTDSLATRDNNSDNSDNSDNSNSSDTATHTRASDAAWDQVICQDVEEFTYALAGLFSHVLKPSVDVAIFASRLWISFGRQAPLGLGLYMLISGVVLNTLRAPHGSFSQGEQHVEGVYRTSVSRLRTYAEQVASLSGGSREYHGIAKKLQHLVTYVRDFAQFRCAMSTIDGIAAKYFLSYLGWLLISGPFLSEAEGIVIGGVDEVNGGDFVSRYDHYHTVSRMMVNLSSAVGALVLSGRDAVRCLGMGDRIAGFEALLDRQKRSRSEMGTETNIEDEIETAMVGAIGSGGVMAKQEQEQEQEQKEFHLRKLCVSSPHGEVLLKGLDLNVRQGQHLLISGPNGGGKSTFLRVLAGLWNPVGGTLARPTCDTFNLGCKGGAGGDKDEEVGVGVGQKETQADSGKGRGRGVDSLSVFYLPQSPYMTEGTLRDQVTYPQSYSHGSHDSGGSDNGSDRNESGGGGGGGEGEGAGKGKGGGRLDRSAADKERDKAIADLLQHVQLSHLLEGEGGRENSNSNSISNSPENENENEMGGRREGPLDVVREWNEALSGGEKQRLSMARMYFNCPRFALLDECTSAVSAEVEDMLYVRAKAMGITLITVSHRIGTRKHHDLELRLGGIGSNGAFTVKEIIV